MNLVQMKGGTFEGGTFAQALLNFGSLKERWDLNSSCKLNLWGYCEACFRN